MHLKMYMKEAAQKTKSHLFESTKSIKECLRDIRRLPTFPATAEGFEGKTGQTIMKSRFFVHDFDGLRKKL